MRPSGQLVNWLNVRTNWPQGSDFGLKTWTKSISFASELDTGSQEMEIVPNFRPIFFWLNVRTRGPQPSICVRTFSQFTIWVNRKKKLCDATLYVRTIFFSIGATLRAIGLFLPHNMAIERGQHPEGKKRKKGLARLCGSTTGAIVLFLQRLRRNLRHIIWRPSAVI